MCTTFSVLPKNGSERSYTARNMDWPVDMKSEVWFVPRARPAPVQAVEENGEYLDLYRLKRWTNQYAFFALNGEAQHDGNMLGIFNDGMNEAGLSASALFLNEGKFECGPPPEDEKGPAPIRDDLIDVATLIEYLLGQFDSVASLVDALVSESSSFPTVTANASLVGLLVDDPKPIKVGDKEVYPCPIHFRVCDRSGDSAVLEWLDGDLHLYHQSYNKDKGPVGPLRDGVANVLTNSPPYAWHLENLGWHSWLALSDRPYPDKVTLPNGYVIRPGAANLGLQGLPSDLSSPTRFLRAAALSTLTSKRFAQKDYFPDEESRINHLFSLAQILAIPKSYRHDLPKKDPSQLTDGRTLWSTVHDHEGAVLYVQSYERKLLLRFDFENYAGEPAQTCCAVDDPELAPYWRDVLPASKDRPVESPAAG